MDLRNAGVLANFHMVSSAEKLVFSLQLKAGVFQPAAKLHTRIPAGPTYWSLYLKMLISGLKNRVWGRGRICHGISMPGNGRMIYEQNIWYCEEMQGRNLCFFTDIYKTQLIL